MAAEIVALIVPFVVLASLIMKKWYNFAQLYTLLAFFGKFGVIAATYITTQNHIGYCYVAP